ncbi:MAG TPA: LuxR C-terminal-related transcriptional regulator [Acidimicrobiales bacterium]|jgi:DNA-binding CsgD family transcriptional regulator
MATIRHDGGVGTEPNFGEWPLVGRNTELSLLTRCLAGRGAVVAGVAGVGKTRLAREAESIEGTAGRTVERFVATRSAQTLPLATFARFRSHDVPGEDPLVAVRRALTADHPPGRLLVSVDDAHLLDDASAVVVHELCASGAATVLATVRNREPARDAITALWRDGLCERIELQSLAQHEITQLLSTALGAAVDNATAYALWERSRGNVMHLRELVRGGISSGALTRNGSLWAWSGDLHAPPRLVELLADRLRTLDRPARRAMELLALGEPLPWDGLVDLVATETAESLVEAGLVETADDSTGLTARLSHPLLGDVLQAELPEPTRRRLLVELAGTVDPATAPVRVASWQLEAGVEAPPELLTAASRECAFADAVLGERLARAALEAGAGLEAVVLLAQHLMFRHRAADAEAALAAVDTDGLTAGKRVPLTVSHANVLTWGLGRPDDAVGLIDTSAIQLEAPAQGELLSHAVPMLVFAGRVDEAIARARDLIDEKTTPAVQRLRAALGAVPALVAAGRPDEALSCAGEALPLVPKCSRELPVALAQLGAGITLAQLLSGDLDAAEGLIRPAYDEGVTRNIPLLRGGAALRLGQVALWRGHPAQAAALLREAILALQQADAGLLAWAADTQRIASALLGRPDGIAEAEAVAASALRFPLFVTEAHRADAAVAAAAGEVTRARACVEAGLEEAADRGHLIQMALLLFDLARYGDPHGAARRLDEVATVEGALAELMRDATTALVDRDGVRLDEVSRAFEARGYDLFAAEMARAAARAHGDAGLQARERQADARADLLATTRCDQAQTPLLADRPAGNELTVREREVAQLAARGQSDAEIARQLGLSVRTVETHLHRAYTKLGLTGRADLADLLT